MQYVVTKKKNSCFSVHRIGRTGRSEKTGIATTFVNKANDESVLLDLKHLLMEANQKVPLFLASLKSENEKYLDLGGEFNFQLLFEIVDFLIYSKSFLFQTKEDAVTAADWVTESQIVRNWKPYNPKLLVTSEEETIWPTIQPITKNKFNLYIFLKKRINDAFKYFTFRFNNDQLNTNIDLAL